MANKKTITDEKAYQIYLRAYSLRHSNVTPAYFDNTFDQIDSMEAQAAFALGVQDAVQDRSVNSFVEFSQRIHDTLSVDTVD